jgi:alkanesulfonate monooxygenase SsuD/methylene tetrahydromethanopterin reductase-like flavin-dependent oxidoreductase (luciferase family)
MAERGFGVAGALDHWIVRVLAQEAERLGFASFWINDTPEGNSLAGLAVAAAATTAIRLGSGVIPIDRRPSEEIAREVANLELPVERLLIGIGSGGLHTRPVEAVADAVRRLREQGRFAIAVGALGPRMVALGAREADAVLLNWITPQTAAQDAERIGKLASEGREGRRHAGTIAYVRTALPEAVKRLEIEASRYESYPSYAAHFKRMGVTAMATTATGEPAEIQQRLGAFDRALDEVVVRAVTPSDEADAYLRLMRAAAPGR